MSFDSQGRMFFSSDATGEIYMVTSDSTNNGSTDGAPIPSSTPSAGGGSTSMTAGNTATQTSYGQCLLYVCFAAIAVAAFLL